MTRICVVHRYGLRPKEKQAIQTLWVLKLASSPIDVQSLAFQTFLSFFLRLRLRVWQRLGASERLPNSVVFTEAATWLKTSEAATKWTCSTKDALERTQRARQLCRFCIAAKFTKLSTVSNQASLCKQNIAPIATTHWSWAEFTAKLKLPVLPSAKLPVSWHRSKALLLLS